MIRNGRRRSKLHRPPVMGMATNLDPHESWGARYLLSRNEVAYRLSISTTMVSRLMESRELDIVRIGRRVFVTATSIEEFLTRHTSSSLETES